MQKTDELVNTLVKAVNDIQDKKAKGYDTQAKVTRVEGSTAYVHIPGGVDETPAQMTINAKKGDTVRVRVAGGTAWLVGNATNPPTDDATANAASIVANTANAMAGEAIESANIAAEAAESAQDSARRAETSANEAKESATQANIYANGALTSLADVEDVINVLDWIQQHGTYAVTSDETVVPGKFYFTRTGSGTAQDPYVYTVVDNPQGDPSAQGYYECTGVDEAITNFVTTHLSVTNQGLFVLNDNSGWKVLIKSDGVEIRDPQNATAATYGASTTVGYTASGHTILSSNGMEILNGSTSLASFSSTVRIGQNVNGKSRAEISTGGMQVYNKVNGADVQIVNLGYGQGKSETGGTANTPYTTLGTRKSNSTIGNYSIAVGNDVEASGASSVAMGSTLTVNGVKHYPTATGVASAVFNAGNSASGKASFAVGETNSATGEATFVAGAENTAAANITFAMGSNLTTDVGGQLVIGRYNAPEKDSVTSRKKAFVIGNGTSSTASNAFTVDWEGNTELALNTSAASGTVDGALYAAITALGWQSAVID